MTSFFNEDNEYLEYEGDDVALTKQAVSFLDFKIKGDISISFDLPNTSTNRRILGYYGHGQNESPAFSRLPFTMVRDGNKISTGYIVIESSDDDFISGYFISGNANWFDAFKFNLKDIDYSAYVVSADSHDSRKSLNDGVIWPVVDWAFHGQKLGYAFCHTTGEGGIKEMHPCFFLHTLVREVANHSGVKLSGALLDDFLFKHIAITPDGPDLQWTDAQIAESLAAVKRSSATALTTALQVVPFDFVTEGGNYDTSNYRYTAIKPCTIKVSVDIRTSVSQVYFIYSYVNGSLSHTLENSAVAGTTFFKFCYENLQPGDYVEIFIDAVTFAFTLQAASNVRYEIFKTIEPAYFDGAGSTSVTAVKHIPYVTPAAIVPDMDALELIKWASFYFSCIPVYDIESNTLTLDPVINLRKEDAVDWSKYYVSHKVDWNTGAATFNRIQTPDVPDLEISSYNRQNLTRYGGGTIETDFEIEKENEVFEMPFAGSWDVPNETTLDWFLPYIEFYTLEDDREAMVSYTSVTNAGGVAGTARFNFAVTGGISDYDVVKVISASGKYSGYGVVYSSSSSQIHLYGVNFDEDDTGIIIRQNISSNTAGHRILLVWPGSNVADAGAQTGMVFRYADVNQNVNTQPVALGTSALACLAWFDKPKVGYEIDNNRHSLSIDNLLNRGYNNTVGDKYHGVMRGIFNGPRIKAKMLLPENEFTGFDFSYIYIEAQDLKGYFLCEKIDRYLGPDTESEVWLYGGN